ncbi:MAG TPA: hypothetical protein VFA68_09315 [Terriglobales bacterium]|nr:hypothetical protein [Terriglobales bacterium]
MDRCEIVLSRNVGDADGDLCSRDTSAICADCGSEICDLHAEECELCGGEFCSMCMIIHAREPHAKRPAAQSEQNSAKRKRLA